MKLCGFNVLSVIASQEVEGRYVIDNEKQLNNHAFTIDYHGKINWMLKLQSSMA